MNRTYRTLSNIWWVAAAFLFVIFCGTHHVTIAVRTLNAASAALFLSSLADEPIRGNAVSTKVTLALVCLWASSLIVLFTTMETNGLM